MKINFNLFLMLTLLLLFSNCKKEEDSYTLTLTINIENAGLVNGGGNFIAGKVVDLSATPSAGFVFSCWTHGTTVVNTNANFPYTTLSEDVTLTANFIETQSLTLAVNPENSGLISGSGGTYNVGTEVNLTAIPKSGYTFVNWTQGATLVSTNANINYTIPSEDVTLTANFELRSYTLTLAVTPENSGLISGSGGTYNVGTEVSLTAIPKPGYAFVNWTQGLTLVSTNANINYTIPSENVTLTANFELIHYALTLYVNPENSGVTTGGGTYSAGENIDITATPNSGYIFLNWTKGSSVVSTNANITYTTTNEDVTLVANFAHFTNILTIQPNATDGIDAYITDYAPNTNLGTHPDFAAIAWTTSGTPSIARGFIKFDFSSLPAGANIVSVKLSLYGYNSPANGAHSTLSGSNSSAIRRVIANWDESTVTWNNQPASTSEDEIIIPQSILETQNYLDIDVTLPAKYMIDNPSLNYGFIIKLVNESYYRKMVFASSDNSNSSLHPRIDIYYSSSK
jgi:uncharacterized repeat protein (TIGR02543 family)